MHDRPPETGAVGEGGREQRPNLYARIGPNPFATLAQALYEAIDRDQRIRAMFPQDLGAESHSVQDMREFMSQFFGGPAHYSERKGHPRLRARHMRFPIDQAARDAWLENARTALAQSASLHALGEGEVAEIDAYLVHASQFMVNRE